MIMVMSETANSTSWLDRQRYRLALWLLGRTPDDPQPMHWTDEAVSSFWTGNARTPLEALAFGRTASRPLLLAVKHMLRPTDRCLDFGAGSGYLVEALLAAGYKAAACEPSDGRRAALETKLAGRPGFLGVVQPSQARDFDVVFVAEVVEHILADRFDATMRGLVASLRPGGLMVVTTPNNENLELGQSNCPVCGTLFHRWQHVRSFTPVSLAETLRTFGVEPIVTHVVEFNPAFFASLETLEQDASDENLMDYLRALRKNEPIRIGSENSILYLGRRTR